MASLGTVTRGDIETIPLVVKNANGTLRDITTDSLKFTIKKSENDATYVVQKTHPSGMTGGSGIVKSTQSGGTVGGLTVTLNPADLAQLDRPRTLYADLEVTDSTGKPATTLFTLNFILDIST